MKAALDWIAATLSPPPPVSSLSALDDPFYQPQSVPLQEYRIQMTEAPVASRQHTDLDGETQKEREDRLCELVYTGLCRVSPLVRKSMLYSNDMIASSETDAYGKLVRTVYWMGENHLYAIVFMSCHGAPSSDLYNRPYVRSTMGGMQMVGIPSDSVALIVDALWEQIINRGYKVYSEDCKEEIRNSDAAASKTGEIVATAASCASSSSSGIDYDAQAEEPTEKSKMRRQRQEPETDKNK